MMVVVAASLVVAGCGSAHTTSTRSSATTTTGLGFQRGASLARHQVLRAYTDMWADMAAAAQSANYQNPILADHASGTALATLVHGLYAYRQQGLVIKGEPSLHPQVVSISPLNEPTTATISDCFDDSHWLVYRASGGLKDNIPGGHRHVTAVLQLAGGAWKVTQLQTGPEGSC